MLKINSKVALYNSNFESSKENKINLFIIPTKDHLVLICLLYLPSLLSYSMILIGCYYLVSNKFQEIIFNKIKTAEKVFSEFNR